MEVELRRRHGRTLGRQGREERGGLRPAQALHRRARAARDDSRAHGAAASDARRDRDARVRRGRSAACSSRSRRRASSTRGRPGRCWCGSRARSLGARRPRVGLGRRLSWSATTRSCGPSTARRRRASVSRAGAAGRGARPRSSGCARRGEPGARPDRPWPALSDAVSAEPENELIGARAARGGGLRWLRSRTRELLDACVHCGFCLPACPTYDLWGQEQDSPRGRIMLMDLVERGELPMDDSVALHIDRCLGCLACVPACPSGVRYDLLIERTRAKRRVEAPVSPAKPRGRHARLSAVFTRPRLLRALSLPLAAGIRPMALAPRVSLSDLRARPPRYTPARGSDASRRRCSRAASRASSSAR